MTDDKQDNVNDDELEESNGELLPDREEMAMMPFPDPIGGGAITLPVEPPATE